MRVGDGSSGDTANQVGGCLAYLAHVAGSNVRLAEASNSEVRRPSNALRRAVYNQSAENRSFLKADAPRCELAPRTPFRRRRAGHDGAWLMIKRTPRPARSRWVREPPFRRSSTLRTRSRTTRVIPARTTRRAPGYRPSLEKCRQISLKVRQSARAEPGPSLSTGDGASTPSAAAFRGRSTAHEAGSVSEAPFRCKATDMQFARPRV